MAKDFVYEIRGFGGLSEDTDGQTASQSGKSPDTVNFTLTSDHRLQKREGFRTVKQFSGRIRGIWSGILANTHHLFVVEGVRVWHRGEEDAWEQLGTLPGIQEVQTVEFGGKLYFLTGMGMRRFCPKEGYGELEPYRPLVMAGSGPDGLGTPVEEANLLGGRCRQQFSSREGSGIYHLCLTDIDSVDYVKVDGMALSPSEYEVHLAGGLVTILTDLPDSTVENVEIGFTKHNVENERRVTRCRYASVYGGNNETALFLWGNEDFPAMRLHSGNADGAPSGEYFPETAYVQVGDGSAITGILRYYDRQLIFTREAAYACHGESATDAFGRSRNYYPVQLISGAAGNLAVGSACLMGNTPVSVTVGGLCRWQVGSLRDETNAAVFSRPIGKGVQELLSQGIRLFYHGAKERLYLWSEQGKFYVYDAPTDSFWRYEGWKPTCFFEDRAKGQLYFGTAKGGLCLVGGTDDDGAPIEAHWYSRELDLGASSHTKSLFRAGVVLQAQANPKVKLECFADVEGKACPNSAKLAWEEEKPLVDFSQWSFSLLSFLTADYARNLLSPLRLRRFRRIQLCLREKSDRALQVESIRLMGRINDKQV